MEAEVAEQDSPELSQTAEDYLRTLMLLEEHSIATTPQRVREMLGVSLATVSSAIKRLEREGLLYRGERYRIHLTPVGRVAACSITRRVRLMECFLYQVLNVPFAEVGLEAGRMGHAVSPATERQLYLQLERPNRCPHGNPIDPEEKAGGSRLGSFRFGQIEIVRVLEAAVTDTGFMGWLDAHGVLPGRRFEVVGSSTGRILLANSQGTVGVPRPAAELVMAEFARERRGAARRQP